MEPHESLLGFDGQRRSRIPQRYHHGWPGRHSIQAQLARGLGRAQPSQREVEQLRQHLRELRHGARDHRQISRHGAVQLYPELPKGRLALRQHSVDHDGCIARLRGARGVHGKLQEVTGDLGGAPDLAVQQHEGARALRIERAAVQQIGKPADRRETIVQRVEDVRRAFIEDDVFDFRWAQAGFGGRRGWRGDGTNGRCSRPRFETPEQVSNQRADGRIAIPEVLQPYMYNREYLGTA